MNGDHSVRQLIEELSSAALRDVLRNVRHHTELRRRIASGMVDERWVMGAAILISSVFILAFAKPIGDFVERHPTVKILALSFLIMIGLVLIADGFGQHISKGYIYTAMAFSVFVEMINLWIRKREARKTEPVKLRERYEEVPSE